jgi:hypothetical protein
MMWFSRVNKCYRKEKPWITEKGSRERSLDHDLKVLVEYIKIDLFPKAKFVLGKDEWDKMLSRENWVADNEGGRKRKAHGEDLDESTEQEGAEEGAGSEKKCCVHGDAEQVHRYVAQLRGGV